VTDINQFYRGENSFLTNNQFLETEKDGADEMQKWVLWGINQYNIFIKKREKIYFTN